MGYSIVREYWFSAAHMLPGQGGKCERLHGHNYKVAVSVYADMLVLSGPERGMVLDFSTLDAAVQPVIAKLDHRFLANGDERILNAHADALIQDDVMFVHVRTTAENLARYLHSAIQTVLPNFLIHITLWETPKSSASYPGELVS